MVLDASTVAPKNRFLQEEYALVPGIGGDPHPCAHVLHLTGGGERYTCVTPLAGDGAYAQKQNDTPHRTDEMIR